jgi:O-antigen/teichoic acid export membrane protein
VVTRVLLIILFYLYISHYLSQKGLVIGLVVSYVIPFLAIVFYAIKILKWRIGSFTNYIQKENVFEELKYGSGMLLLTIFSNVSNFLDGIILPAYLGLEVLGIYTPALVLGQMIQVPYRAISLISIPVLREAITQKDVAKLKSLNNSLGINLFLIGCFLFTLLIINSEAIFSLIPPKYSAAKNVLLIVGAGRLLDMAFGLNSEIITYSNDYKYIVRLSGLMMTMTVILNILLIPIFGMDGAALAVSVSLIVFNLLKTYIIYRKYNFHCFSKHYITLIVITISVIGILYCIPYVKFLNQHMFLNPILNIAFKSIIGGFLFLIPSYYFNISTDFNDFFKLVISGKILKGGHKMENL